MSRLIKMSLLLSLLLLLLAACGDTTDNNDTVDSGVNEQEVAIAVALTQTAAVPTEAPPSAAGPTNPQPTEAPTPANETGPTPNPIATEPTDSSGSDFTGVTLGAGSTVADQKILLREPFSPGPGPGNGRPETIALTLQGDWGTAELHIFAVEEYLGIFSGGWSSISRLQTLLRERPENINDPLLPFLPPPNASQVFGSQFHYIDFNNGAGIGYITHYGQAPVPVQDELLYTFQGLTNDNQYYVALQTPITTAGIVPISGANLSNMLSTERFAGFNVYIEQTVAQLNSLAPADFSPNFAELDALLATLQVAPTNFPSPGYETAVIDRCINDAEFVTDITIPLNTEIDGGTTFAKTWRIRNTGTCTWTNLDYGPTFIEGDKQFPGSGNRLEQESVAPGEEADITVEFTAPPIAGTYTSRWRMNSPGGFPFGPTVFTTIVVPETIPGEYAADIPGWGSIEGTIGFSAESVPAMVIYFQNIYDADGRYALNTQDGWTAYYNVLPEGLYYVFAEPQDNETGFGGGYTEYVLCGLIADCTDHTLLVVAIVAGQTTSNVDILDWAAPEGWFPLP